MRGLPIFFMPVFLAGCVVFPVVDKEATRQAKVRCELSSDKKILKVIDVAKETNTFYSVSGLAVTPVVLPLSGIISGTYTLVNNIYFYGEQELKCDDKEMSPVQA